MTRVPDLPLAVSLGDPAGIGPEVIAKCWDNRSAFDLPPFVAIGDGHSLAAVWDGPITVIDDPGEADAAFDLGLPLLQVSAATPDLAGHPSIAGAHCSLDSLELAVGLARSGSVAAVVTGPVAKEQLYAIGFTHPGHTEFLAELATRDEKTPLPVMLLWSPTLAVVPVTIHVPLREAIAQLTSELIVTTSRILVADLIRRFGIARPRLAIAGLNPHAGENGSLGHEDQAIVAPAVATLRAEGIDARGPLPADTMFHAAARQTYDCAVCMYHDQALIPIKTLAFDDGVNVTLGLPFIRTSPDHGTAFDIAGTGRANPSSLIAALRLAARMAASQG